MSSVKSNSINTSSASNTFAAACAAVGLILLAVIFFPTLKEVALICWNDDDYSHGILLPVIAAYLFHKRRSETLSAQTGFSSPAPRIKNVSFLGLVLFLGGMTVYVFGAVSGLLFINWVAFFLTLSGFIYLVSGAYPPAFLLPAIWLNFMAKPLPDSLTPKLFGPLQTLAAKVSAELLSILKVPVYISGNIIEVPGMTLLVEEACSGMRSVMSLLTVALIVLFLVPLSRVGQLIVIASAVIIAVLLNILRVAATGVLAHFYDPDAATGFFHTFTGMVVFIVGLAVLYSLTSILERYSWAKQKR